MGKPSRPELPFSHKLLKNSDFAKQYVRDYTQRASDFILDIRNLKADDKPIVIRIQGRVASLHSHAFKEDFKTDYEKLSYQGIFIVSGFPLYFTAFKDNKEVPDLELEEMILESGKITPITITGTLRRDSGLNRYPYLLSPQILELGEYCSPNPLRI
jgi:hypothetical protein